MIYAVLILFLLFLVTLVITICEKGTIEKQKEEYAILENKFAGLEKEYNSLHEIMKIKSENRKEADEKKNELYNGDPVDNAISGLSKHSN